MLEYSHYQVRLIAFVFNATARLKYGGMDEFMREAVNYKNVTNFWCFLRRKYIFAYSVSAWACI